jgi:hypothetical protein
MKKLAGILVTLALGSVFALAQTDSSVHVKSFPGNTVGQKVSAAMLTCPAAPTPCILVIDASLATAAAGTMPSLCGNCYLQDFRTGPPTGFTSLIPEYSSACGTGADESLKLSSCMSADLTASNLGRKYFSSVTGTQAWSANPFAALSGEGGNQPNYEVDLNPTQSVTADAEIDMYTNTTLDCNDTYAGGNGAGSGGAYISVASTGYPTTNLIVDAASASSTAVTQGDKVRNCGFSSPIAGMTMVNFSHGQEGEQARNNRGFGFQICFDHDNTATTGGSFHNWGLYDNQCEMSDSADSEVWGALYSKAVQGGEEGIIENFSAIGGSNTSGNEKVGIENDGSGLFVENETEESLTYGLINHAAHSTGTGGNFYANIGCSNANAASPVCTWDDNTGPDYASTYFNIEGPNTNFLQSNEPTAAALDLHGDPVLGFYTYDGAAGTASAVVLTDSPQIASSNMKLGDSYSNAAAWPSWYLPAKTVSMTISSVVFEGVQYMTTTDQSAGLLPDGIATNGDLVQQTAGTVHAMAITDLGPVPCIFDGATTANDYVVIGSAVWNGTSAVPCHDAGSTRPTNPIGRVQKSVAAAQSAPTAPTVTTNCTGTCATTYTYKLVQMSNTDPLDKTQSAGSTATSVSSAAVLDSSTYNTITAPSTCTGTAPCELYETAGPHVGWLQEITSTTSIRDNGLIGVPVGGAPYSVGIIAPPVHVRLGTL